MFVASAWSLRERLEFYSLFACDCTLASLAWYGWLPGLSGNSFGSPWAESVCQVAAYRLEWVIGPYRLDAGSAWNLDTEWDEEGVVGSMPGYPCIWSDGSTSRCQVSHVFVTGTVYSGGTFWALELLLGSCR